MSEELTQVVRIEGQDTASAMLKGIVETMKAMEKQAERTGKALAASFGGAVMKPLVAVRSEARGLGTDVAEAADKAAKALRGDVAAVVELRAALKAAAAEQKALGTAMQAAQRAGAGTVQQRTIAARNAATGRARAEADDCRQWRAKWRRRQASERADATDLRRRLAGGRYLMSVRQRSERLAQREADRVAKAEAAATARREKTEAADLNRPVRAMRYLSGVRDRSERAELAGIARIRRERDAMRRHAASAGRHAYGHARHAVRSINHPAFESIGHATALGAAFGAAAAAKIIESSIDIDSAAARYRMFAVPDGVDATKATAEAVRAAKLDSIKLGMDASTLLDIQAKAVRDGITPAIAKTLPASIASAPKVMGGDPERLTDTLSEGIQQGLSMGLMKDAGDVRRFLNLEAGLSNYAGNSSEKMEQFVAAGGIGRGKELGLSLTETMAYGTLLNSSGIRTGQATSRFLGQLSQSVPKMSDKYREAVESHRNTEESRAVRSAPGALGYGSIREMQARILAGPVGLIEFSRRLNKLNEKQRKLILEGYGFSEQGGAALAEIGASPAKAKGVLTRTKELASQAQANDYLAQKFADWQTSLANMLQQIEAGWRAVESEVGDVLKNDIVAPIRDWWMRVSAAILGSGMKDDAHRAIMAFLNGLGFADMRTALDSLSGSINTDTIVNFAKGIGEGLREVYDSVSELAGLSGGGSGLDAEAVGKFASELFGLSMALHVMAPVLTIIGGIVSAFLAVKAAVEFGDWVAKLTGVSDGLKGILALDLAGGAAGLVSLAGGIAALLGLAKFASDKGMLQPPKSWDMRGFLDFLDPNFGNLVLGKQGQAPGDGMTGEDFVKGPHGGLLRKQSFDGGAENWRDLLTQASYSPSDADDVARDAMVDTARGVVEVREAIDRLGAELRTAALSGSGSGSDGGSGGGAGLSNMRYGRTSSGAFSPFYSSG